MDSDSTNPLVKLRECGQSIWLDFIDRAILEDGTLRRLIDEDAIAGMTSNPAIFQKAIQSGKEYEADIRAWSDRSCDVDEIYEALVIADIQAAADQFRAVYDRTDGADGYVSLEVSPHLAHDTDRSIDEAHRLWRAVDRPNAMIKIPGTAEGIPVIRALIAEGINVNVTLLFGLERYEQAALAYIEGLEQRKEQGASIDRIASVASFFLSRIDVLVDGRLDEQSGDGETHPLRGRAAVASARMAYQRWKELFNGPRWDALSQAGAMPQRLLWASTSTKDPSYPDVKYVEALIGPQTVNTLPTETVEAYRDHGEPACRVEQEVQQAVDTLAKLEQAGLPMQQVAAQLEDEGIDKFVKPFDQLLETLSARCREVSGA